MNTNPSSDPAEHSTSGDSITWKPDYVSMILHPIITYGVPGGFVLLALYLGLRTFSSGGMDVGTGTTRIFLGSLFLILLIVLAGIGFWNHVRWKKTQYELTDEHLLFTTGSPVNERTVDVLWSKAVQPRLNISFVQKTFLGTGDILIDAAGQSGTEIVLSELPNPEEKFKRTLTHLREPVSFQNDALKSTYTPSSGGILLDFLLFTSIVTVPFLSLFLNWIPLPVSSLNRSGIALPGLLISIGYSLYSVLVKQNTCYRIHDHYVEREIRFLGLERVIVPLSELSDVHLQTPFYKRCFGIYDLELSLPGLSNDVLLSNLDQQDQLSSFLLDRSNQIQKEHAEQKRKTDRTYHLHPQLQAYLALPVLLVLVTSILSPFLHRFLTGLGIESLSSGERFAISSLPAGGAVLYLLWRYIRWAGSEFIVKGNQIQYSFTFLNQFVTSLNSDLIKVVIKKESPLERLFNAYTLEFHSIGTAEDLRFFSITNTSQNSAMFQYIREMEGVHETPPKNTITPDYTVMGLFIQNTLTTVGAPLFVLINSLTAGILIPHMQASSPGSNPGYVLMYPIAGAITALLILVGSLIYYSYYYSHNYLTLHLHEDFLEFKEGLFFRKQLFLTYDNIRNIEYVEEPFSRNGWLSVDYAGGTKGWGFWKGKNFLPHQPYSRGFQFHHLAEVVTTSRTLERRFTDDSSGGRTKQRQGAIENTEEQFDTFRPIAPPYLMLGGLIGGIPGLITLLELASVRSGYGFDIGSILGIELLFLVIPPLFGIIFSSIAYDQLWYAINDQQIERKFFLGLGRTKSIKFVNIDSIEIQRTFLDKLFGTGSISVATTGEAEKEMNMNYIRDYQHVYDRIRTKYTEATNRDLL